MLSGFRVKLDGIEDVTMALTIVSDMVSDLTPFWPAYQEAFFEMERDWFFAEGRGSWPPKQKDNGMPILRESDALFGSLTGDTGGTLYDPHPDFLLLGTTVTSEDGYPYPSAHHTGAGDLPVREVIPIDEGIITEAFKKPIGLTARAIRNGWEDLTVPPIGGL